MPCGLRSTRRPSTDTTSAAQCSRRTRSSPSADGPELAMTAGVAAFIQPGGSKRDEEVVAAVDAANATMIFTGRRHFRH